MLGQCHEMLAHQRASPRWKEWIPLVSQQLRLRNLIQVIAYNVNVTEKVKCDTRTKALRPEKIKSSFYYTLHLTTMSAPFYTSEKLETENPKWAEIEIGDTVNGINASVNGIVVRLWMHRNSEQDQVLTVWGVYFSGLIYLGPKLCSDPAMFCLNTIVFHMQGGYFTAAECFKEHTHRVRHSQVKINAVDIRPSYTVSLVSRLHTIQQAIKKQRCAAQILREKISVGGYTAPESRESATLRRLLNKSRPQAPQRQEVLKLQREIEMTKFRVEMLAQERSRKVTELQNYEKSKNLLCELNQDRGTELMNNYQTLHKEMERLKERKKTYIETRDAYLTTNAQLIFRQKQLISKLNQIYPILQLSNGKFSICGVHLPNSEDFAGNDEIMISVALGYVSHVLQMISIFLQVPLRYPIIHFGSWSKVVDHVVEKIPEKDREFPLYSRGKDKLQYNYGVYLLNKNVSQLRWYCGLQTQDLRATLLNLSGLLHVHPINVPEYQYRHQHTSSGSSLDLRSSSQNQSPVGSVPAECQKQPTEKEVPNNFEKGHRVSRSMDGSGINFQSKSDEPDVQSVKDFHVPNKRTDLVNGTPSVTASLSYSLDKGLDEYEELKRAEVPSKTPISLKPQTMGGRALASVSSEPILTQDVRDNVEQYDDTETVSSGDEAKKHFLQSWQAHGPAPICSDDDLEGLPQLHLPNNTALPENLEIQAEEVVAENSVRIDSNTREVLSVESQESVCSEIPELQMQVITENNTVSLPENHVDLGRKTKSISNNGLDTNDTRTISYYSPVEAKTIDYECAVTVSHSDYDVERRESKYSVEGEINPEISPSVNRNSLDENNHVPETSVTSKKDIMDEAVSLEEINSLIDSSVLVDSVFASVASRTEALASRSGTFNLVRSRHSSMLEDGNS